MKVLEAVMQVKMDCESRGLSVPGVLAEEMLADTFAEVWIPYRSSHPSVQRSGCKLKRIQALLALRAQDDLQRQATSNCWMW
jgi:hypothetical protein